MQDLFTNINPAEAAIIATVFSALLILAIILSVRAYFYQSHAKQQAEQLEGAYETLNDTLNENLRLKTENESLTTRCTNLLASLHERENYAAKKDALLVEQEITHQTAVENAAKYAKCLDFVKSLNRTILLENGELMPNPVLYWLEKIEEDAQRLDRAVLLLRTEQLKGSKFYHDCKQFVDQNNLVENSDQRSDNVVIEALHSLAGKVINQDKEIGRIRAEFEKYGAKFKTRANTAGQVAEKLATMHRKVYELVEAATEIPKKGQVPREKYNRLLTAVGKLIKTQTHNHKVREGGVCA